MIHELFAVVASYLISRGIPFSVKKSKTSESIYVKVGKTTIRISNHLQEDSNDIQVVSITDLVKVFNYTYESSQIQRGQAPVASTTLQVTPSINKSDGVRRKEVRQGQLEEGAGYSLPMRLCHATPHRLHGW